VKIPRAKKKGSVTELPGLPSSTHCGHTATLTTIYGSTQIGVCMRSLKNLLTSSSDRTSCMPLSLSITSGKSLMVTRSAPDRPLCRDELHHSKRIRGDNVNDRVRSCSWVNWLCSVNVIISLSSARVQIYRQPGRHAGHPNSRALLHP
jgi:hypothetical protein